MIKIILLILLFIFMDYYYKFNRNNSTIYSKNVINFNNFLFIRFYKTDNYNKIIIVPSFKKFKKLNFLIKNSNYYSIRPVFYNKIYTIIIAIILLFLLNLIL